MPVPTARSPILQCFYRLAIVAVTLTAGLALTLDAVHSRPAPREHPVFELLKSGTGMPTAVSGVTSLASSDTVWFGGTKWNADSLRWEAVRDSVWTFSSGVGSHFDHSAEGVNPFKDPRLHAYMEGWIGIDFGHSEIPYFRRLGAGDFGVAPPCVGSAVGLSGNFSFWAGVLPPEADQLCYWGGAGYGNSWNVCIEHPFAYDGLGSVTLSYSFINETEGGFDFTRVYIDTTGLDDDVELVAYDGSLSGTESWTLIPGAELPTGAGTIAIKFCFSSDGAWSDEDGLQPSSCGAFAVDDILVSGGGISHLADFESDDDGWSLSPFPPGPGGDWSNIVHINDLPPQVFTCPCVFEDSVLVFEDLTVGGHNDVQDNIAASPWVDLKNEGMMGVPGVFLETRVYANMPLINYIFSQYLIQFYPDICSISGVALTSPWTSTGQFYYEIPIFCTSLTPLRVDFGWYVPDTAERLRIGLGVISYCTFFANCNSVSNSSPWYDDVRVGVFGAPGGPLLGTSTVDLPQDSFPQNGTLGISSPGRIDCNNVVNDSQPEPRTLLGDTLVVSGGEGGAEVRVQFSIRPGPGIDQTKLSAFLATVTYEETKDGLDWYSARMDTAQFRGRPSRGEWMTAFHEEDPAFTGTDTDTDPDDPSPDGRTFRLKNDIFPDDLLTPGSRLNLFYRTRYLTGSNWTLLPDTTDGTYLEMEVLPSSMAADSTFNCVLYVDHFDGRGGQRPIEEALSAVLPSGSANFENTAWDRFNVRAPLSQQGSFGRPLETEYGASLAQVLAYQTILWNSGNLSAFAVAKEDADVLIPWLTLPGFNDNHLYLTGDGLAQSVMTQSASDPSAQELLEDYCGVLLICNTFRDEACPFPTSPLDDSPCIDLDPVSGARTANRPLGGDPVGRGNGCPTRRSFDVLFPNPYAAYGAPMGEERYVGSLKSAPFASVSNHAVLGGGREFKTVVDGLSVHHRHDAGDCSSEPWTQPQAIEERLREVLNWFGSSESPIACLDQTLTTAIDRPPGPTYVTALSSIHPNPLPLGTTARIRFSLAQEGPVTLAIFDVQGKRVTTVFDDQGQAGWNEAAWDGTDDTARPVPSGVYFYRLQTQDTVTANKMVVVRGGP